MKYLPFILFIVLAGFLWKGLGINPQHVPSVLIGKPVPAFSVQTLGANTLSPKDFKNKVSLLNIWATWCTACRAEHAMLLKIAASEAIAIYGISYKDSEKQARDLLEALGNPYTKNGFDPDGRVAINWGVYGAPETFVIDKQGIIRYKHIGPLTERVWKETLKPLIATL